MDYAAIKETASSLVIHIQSTLGLHSWTTLGVAIVLTYAFFRSIYLLYFHPLAKFPGPRLAKVSNLWYAYAWLSGRYPYAIEEVLKKYGDVVRTAPNEVVFLTPKAYTDIYTSTINGRPAFVKSDLLDSPDPHPGLASERDIDKHRHARKSFNPAFGPRLYKQYESTMNVYIARFIDRLRLKGSKGEAVDLTHWIEWVTADIGGGVTLSHDFENLTNEHASPVLEAIQNIGGWLTTRFVMRRFPLLYPFHWFLLPPKVLFSYAGYMKANTRALRQRIASGDDLTTPDYLSAVLGKGQEAPPEDFLATHASHLIVGHIESASVVTAGFYFLLMHPEIHRTLQAELRTRFQTYEEITDEALQQLTYLDAVVHETLRLHTNVPYGLPRISPGIEIDGHYIAKGCVVSSAAFATTHSPRYFARPREFRPERWLPRSDPAYDARFDADQRHAFRPFSVGSRNCIGQGMAWIVLRLILGRTAWRLDWDMLNKGEIDWERDLRLYSIWHKPPLLCRFTEPAGWKTE